MKKEKTDSVKNVVVKIQPPRFGNARFHIIGTSPLVMHKFSAKSRQQMKDKQLAGSQANKGTKRQPKDFNELFEGAKHYSKEGWIGIPAASFRNAMISACRLVGFKMTLAKMAIFIECDGLDCDEGTPLVRITQGEPRELEMCVRLETGVADVRVRPQWLEWEADVQIRFDEDILSLNDIANLLARVGAQVGILEGRPDSKNSAGMGWGLFKISEEK